MHTHMYICTDTYICISATYVSLPTYLLGMYFCFLGPASTVVYLKYVKYKTVACYALRHHLQIEFGFGRFIVSNPTLEMEVEEIN